MVRLFSLTRIRKRGFMEVVKGMVVKSMAGHDKGDLQVVVGFSGNDALVCDGKRRKLERPKVKNIKHLEKTKKVLDESLIVSNVGIRRALRSYINDKN